MNLQILISIVITTLAYSRCSFSVDAADKPFVVDYEPFMIGDNPACPFFSNTLVCCLPQQVNSMVRDYQTIDATFGSDGGGCDICGANMKRFWCHYTCDPNQRDFVKVVGTKNITDPLQPDNIMEVQEVELKVHPQVACDVFSSCKRTSFASQVSAMATPGGFFRFQGENAVTQGGQYINIDFQETNSLIMQNIPQCNQTFTNKTIDDKGIEHIWDDFGYEQHEQCGCNTCDLSCSAESTLYVPQDIWYGFEGQYVLFAWGWVILIAIGVTVYRACMRDNIHKLIEDAGIPV